MPSQKQDTLRCPDCKGRCQPWKAGGKIKDPEVASCATCKNTGRVPHPVVKTVTCIGPDDAKTCDGTGLVLTGDVPRTDTGGVGTGRDSLYESGDERVLMPYAEYIEDDKVLDVYVPYLRTARRCLGCGKHGTKKSPHADGCEKPGYYGVPLTLGYNPLLATARVSCRGAVQLFPRATGYIDEETGEYVPSLRECMIPRCRTEVAEVPFDYVLQPGEEFLPS